MTYREACAKVCGWCEKHCSEDKKVTAVLKHSRPNPVHKVYPPHVAGRLSQYLPCTAPDIEAWAEAESTRADKLAASLAIAEEKARLLDAMIEHGWRVIRSDVTLSSPVRYVVVGSRTMSEGPTPLDALRAAVGKVKVRT